MENIQEISLDIMNDHAFDYLFCSQYDIGRVIRITITDHNVPMDLTNVTAAFLMKKPDGHKVLLDTCDVDGSVVSFAITEQMTTAAGKGVYQISLSRGGVVISTIRGDILIERAAVNNDDVSSDDDMSLIQQAIDAAASASASKDEVIRVLNGVGDGDFMLPMGEITFAQLSTVTKHAGYVYSISDPFVSTSDFIDGGGHKYLAGTDVVCIKDTNNNTYHWDALTGIDNVNVTYQDTLPTGGQDIWMKPYTPQPTPFIPPEYSDVVYYTLYDSSRTNRLNQLFIEKIPSHTADIHFVKSDRKIGCRVMNDIFDVDEDLYMSFKVNNDDTQTIYWWTETGEVHYYDDYISGMFNNLNVVDSDLSGWIAAN